MKKLFTALMVAMMFVVVPTRAQSLDQLHWNINAGVNVANYLNTPTVVDAKAKLGAFFGVGVTYDLDTSWFLESGLTVSLKGSSVKGPWEGDLDRISKMKFNPVYLHIPIHAGYKFHFSNGYNLNLSAGPYMAFGLGGKGKLGGEKASMFSSNGFDFKRFDMGLGVKAGMDIDIFNVFVGYDYGLIKLDSSFKARNGNFYAGVGLRF